jgi:hypothetical protein
MVHDDLLASHSLYILHPASAATMHRHGAIAALLRHGTQATKLRF